MPPLLMSEPLETNTIGMPPSYWDALRQLATDERHAILRLPRDERPRRQPSVSSHIRRAVREYLITKGKLVPEIEDETEGEE